MEGMQRSDQFPSSVTRLSLNESNSDTSSSTTTTTRTSTPTLIDLIINHAGDNSHTFTFPSTSSPTLSDLSSWITDRFFVTPSSQKLICKGKIIKGDPEKTFIIDSLTHSTSKIKDGRIVYKLNLIGTKLSELNQFKSQESQREAKLSAFEFHRVHTRVGIRNTSIHGFGEGGNDVEQYKFHRIEPFPESVECFKLRKQMLDKLASDEAVLEIMRERKYVVGVLKELHPLLQPTLLGLNKNAGEEISLRLLTDDLTGCRSYNTVRMVLLHELAHNVFGEHDHKFNELNSAHNKEVALSEQKRGLSPGSSGLNYQVWQPESDPESLEREARRKFSRRLDEVDGEVGGGGRRNELNFGEADEVEARRERVRIAAEKRRREEAEEE